MGLGAVILLLRVVFPHHGVELILSRGHINTQYDEASKDGETNAETDTAGGTELRELLLVRRCCVWTRSARALTQRTATTAALPVGLVGERTTARHAVLAVGTQTGDGVIHERHVIQTRDYFLT